MIKTLKDKLQNTSTPNTIDKLNISNTSENINLLLLEEEYVYLKGIFDKILEEYQKGFKHKVSTTNLNNNYPFSIDIQTHINNLLDEKYHNKLTSIESGVFSKLEDLIFLQIEKIQKQLFVEYSKSSYTNRDEHLSNMKIIHYLIVKITTVKSGKNKKILRKPFKSLPGDTQKLLKAIQSVDSFLPKKQKELINNNYLEKSVNFNSSENINYENSKNIVCFLLSLKFLNLTEINFILKKHLLSSILLDTKYWITNKSSLKDNERVQLVSSEKEYLSFTLLNMILSASSITIDTQKIKRTIIINYFKIEKEITDAESIKFLSSKLKGEIINIENEQKRKTIGKIALSNFSLFTGTDEIRYNKLFNYISGNDISDDKLTRISNFCEESKYIKKLTEEELLFIFENNLEDNKQSLDHQDVKNLVTVTDLGYSLKSVISIGNERLKFIVKNNTAFSTKKECLETSEKPEKLSVKSKKEELINIFKNDLVFLHDSHTTKTEINAFLSSLDNNTDNTSLDLEEEIKAFYVNYNLKEIINFNKKLVGENIEKGMQIINYVHKNFPKARKEDKRSYKNSIKNILNYLFGLQNESREFIFLIIGLFGSELKNKVGSHTDFFEEIQNIANNKNYGLFLLNSGESFTTLNNFLEKLSDDKTIEQTYSAELKQIYGNNSYSLAEIYQLNTTAFTRILQIGKLLGNGDKQTFIDYNDNYYLENEKGISEAKLNSIYRIYSFFVNKFGISNIYNETLELIMNTDNYSEIESRIDYVYKQIGKNINRTNISNEIEFQKNIFTYLTNGDKQLIDNFKESLSKNKVDADNQYDAILLKNTNINKKSEQEISEYIELLQKFLSELIDSFRPGSLTSSTGNKHNGTGSGQYSHAIDTIVLRLKKQNFESNINYINRIIYGNWNEIIGDTDLVKKNDAIIKKLGNERKYLIENLKHLGKNIQNFEVTNRVDLSNIQKIFNKLLDNLLEQYFCKK